MVLRGHMKTATILYYVSPSIETRIKHGKMIDLMEVEKGHNQLVMVLKIAEILMQTARRGMQMATAEV